ncbi:uncharacterized protein [Porites lutea]|uniref:uncharacterized protein n=1 Tax=Porites lutea TaxID=51062 RepID=UPI003CC61C9D
MPPVKLIGSNYSPPPQGGRGLGRKESQELPLSDDSLTTSQEASSSVFLSTSELEELVTPTVAPATPSYDADLSITIVNHASSSDSYSQPSEYIVSSVILIPPSNPSQIQSSQGSQNVRPGTFSEGVVATKEPEVFSSVLDSVPPNPISSEPTPTAPSATSPKEEEDSITAALNQAAEEETKLKEEEMPSFDEFKRRVLQEEEEKSKQQSAENSSGAAPKPKKLKERKQSNYASVDCGAKILDHNSEASNVDSILVENRDLYMLNPCSAQVWFIVELCDLAQVKSIQIANFELFSSSPESFRVYVSKRYPTREWTMLGTFQAREERTIQTFPLDEPIYAKYFKVEMLSHFGSEHYCPLSLLRVHGSSMMEELEDHETDGQEENDNSDSDSDVPVLPPNPSAKVEDQPKEQNLLERAADTVFNLVKKFTGNGHDNKQDKEGDNSKLGTQDNKMTASEKESQGESKGKIVTLVGHEELNENSQMTSDNACLVKQGHSRDRNASQGKCVSGNISHEDSPPCSKADNEGETHTCSPAPSACQLFSQVLGHYSLGCFVGRILFSKNENFTVSMNLATSGDYKRNLTVAHEKDKGESYEKKESQDQEKVPAEQAGEPSTADNSEEKSAELDVVDQEFSVIIPEMSSSVLKISNEVTSSGASGVSEYVDPSPGVLKPSELLNISVSEDEKKRETDDKTPSLAEVSVVTSLPLNATLPASSSVVLKSSQVPVIKDPFVDVPQGESKLHDQQELNKQPVQSIPDRPSTVLGSEQTHSVTKGTSQQPLPLNVKDISSKDEEKVEDNVTVIDELKGSKGKDKTEATPSECKGPNSIHIMSQSSPDIDVLETKLTDKDGREGTAQLPEEVHLEKEPVHSAIEASESTKATDFSSINLDPVRTEGEGLKPDLDNQEPGIDSTKSASKMLESENVDPVIQPTIPPGIDITDTSDPVLPLPSPPVIGDTSLPSHEFSTAASSAEATLDTSILSKAQQAAVSSSAGVSSGVGSGGQKESIFVRLSNKIKVLEQNLNMSTLYMEQLHQRVIFCVIIAVSGGKGSTINNQKEQITKLQSKLDNLTNAVADMKARMDPLNKEVMERHVIGLCIEIVLILLLFLLFAKRNNNQMTSNSPGRSVHLMNGHGPPRLAIEDSKRSKSTVLSEVPRLGGKEQLLFSSVKMAEPESIGGGTDTDHHGNKLVKGSTFNTSESKKKRHRKRKGSSTPELLPDSPSYETSNGPEPSPESHSSADASRSAGVVIRTAGLLFSSARGFFGGLHNPWKQSKPSTVHSDPNISARSELSQASKSSPRPNNPGLSRAKSLELVPENTSIQKPAPPPPAPTLSSEFGVMLKRPPDFYYPKKGPAKNIFPGPVKYGKYGVLDSQLA